MTATVGGNAPAEQQKQDLASAFDLARVNSNGQIINAAGDVVGGGVPQHEVLLHNFKLPSETDYTNAFIRAQQHLFENYNGGEIKLPPGSILAQAIQLRQNIMISGSSWWMNEIKQAPGINANFITLFDNNAVNNGLRDLSIHGNRVLNTTGDAINLQRSSAAGSGDTYDSKTTLHRIRVFYAARDGVYLGENIREIEAYRVFVENCGQFGFNIDTFCTDSFFTLCTSSHNFASGFRNRGSNNRFSQIKAFFNGNTNPRTVPFDWANPNGHGFWQQGGRNNIVACSEVQDCAGNALHIDGGSGNEFIGMSLDTVGFAGTGYGVYVTGSASRTVVRGQVLKRRTTSPTADAAYTMGAVYVDNGSVDIDIGSTTTDSGATINGSNPNARVIINRRLVNGLPDSVLANSNYSVETQFVRSNGTLSKAVGFNFSGNDRYLIGCFDNAGAYLGDAFQARGDGSTVVGISGRSLSLYGGTPVPKPTTAVATSAFVANSGTAVNSASTFDGYTIGQVVNALRQVGLLT